jgi:hypothetical protein
MGGGGISSPDAMGTVPDAGLQEADFVQLTGLVGAAHYNGRLGQLLLYRGERWVVLLHDKDPSDPQGDTYLSLRARSLIRALDVTLGHVPAFTVMHRVNIDGRLEVYSALTRHCVEKLRFLCSPGERDWEQAVAQRDAALALAADAWSTWTSGASEIYKFLAQAFQKLGDARQALDMLLQNAAMFAEAQNQTWLADAWCKCGEPSVFLSKRDIREDGSGKRAPQRDIGVYWYLFSNLSDPSLAKASFAVLWFAGNLFVEDDNSRPEDIRLAPGYYNKVCPLRARQVRSCAVRVWWSLMHPCACSPLALPPSRPPFPPPFLSFLFFV